jgi:hypothetical protein
LVQEIHLASPEEASQGEVYQLEVSLLVAQFLRYNDLYDQTTGHTPPALASGAVAQYWLCGLYLQTTGHIHPVLAVSPG